MPSGAIEKMQVEVDSPIQYALPIGDALLPMNPLLGNELVLAWEGEIRCVHCDRKIKKSFNQGYCFPCFQKLAECDQCVVKPELCHYAAGTCRDPQWGETYCLIPHTVYLANSSGLKVGVTRGLDPRTRWVDQGATQGLAIRTVPNRLDAGVFEVALKAFVDDKTNWRRMLEGPAPPLDLAVERDRVLGELEERGDGAVLPGECPQDAIQVELEYPVLEYPTKIKSHNLDKSPRIEGTLLGIKGQYLILDTGVINLRKYGGYVLAVSD